MNAWSLQGGTARLAPSPHRPKTDKPILRAHQRALRRLVAAVDRSPRQRYRTLAADLLKLRRQSAVR